MSKAHNSDAPDKMAVNPTAAQQELLDRIETQRERIRARRSARVQARTLAQQPSAGSGGSIEGTLLERAIVFAKEHPLAIAGAVAAVVVAGPGRVVRWAGIVLPLIARFRR